MLEVGTVPVGGGRPGGGHPAWRFLDGEYFCLKDYPSVLPVTPNAQPPSSTVPTLSTEQETPHVLLV